MNSWELIFRVSKVAGAGYDENRLPVQNWEWPQGTWFQRRLRYLRNGHGKYTKALAGETRH
jgi:hypothetical protein